MWSAVKKAYQNRRENIDKPEKKSSKKNRGKSPENSRQKGDSGSKFARY